MTIKIGEICFEDVNRQTVRELFGDAYERRVHGEENVLGFLADLRALMKEKGVKQAELARLLEVDKGQMSRWLSAKKGVRAATMFTIADALGYQLDLVWRPVCSGWGYGSSVSDESEPLPARGHQAAVVCETLVQVADPGKFAA
jgi:transcriptional regulator with XRE-family HTH domain